MLIKAFVCLLFLSLCSSLNAEEKDTYDKKHRPLELQGQFLKDCHEIIGTSSQVQDISIHLEDVLNNLSRKKFISQIDTDVSIRSLFVNMQAVIEQALSLGLKKGTIDSVVGVIHTPTPATPFCTRGEVSEGLVDASVKEDLKRLFTIKSRPQIARDLLLAGGKIYIAYPEMGINARSKEQINIYHEELNKYSECLYDSALSCEQLPSDLVGASYLFQIDQDVFGFSIQASQANAPEDERVWSLWLGNLDDPKVSKRIITVLDFIRDYTLPKERDNARD